MFALPAMAKFAKYVPFEISGYTGPVVTDYPVLVKINATKVPGIYSAVKHAGMDLKFTDVSGVTVYPHDVDVWDTTGTSLVWVKIPSLENGASFRMYYGDDSKTTNPTSGEVWSAYHGVWHFTDLKDASTNHYDGTDISTKGQTTGPVGKGWTISNSTTAGDRRGAIACMTSYGLEQGNTLTWSGWIKTTSTSSDEFMCPMAKRPLNCWKNSPAETFGGFAFLWNGDASGWGFYFSYGNGRGKIDAGGSGKMLNTGDWRFVAISAENGSFKSYFNGALNQSVTETTRGVFTNNANYPLVIGNESSMDSTRIGTAERPSDSTEGLTWQGQGSAWKGSFDEFRLHKGARSADDIAAEYNVSVNDVTVFGESKDIPAYVVLLAADVSSGRTPLNVNFTATPDEDFVAPVTYSWDFDNDGNFDFTSTSPTASHQYTVRGSYAVRVKAMDKNGIVAEETVPDFIHAYDNVYVDANVASSGNGLKTSPFKTLKEGLAAAGPTESVMVCGGRLRRYRFVDCDDSCALTVAGLKVVGCDPEWNPATGYADTNAMAVIEIYDDYSARSKAKTSVKDWNAPFIVSADNCTISGLFVEFGNASFKQQDNGGQGFISVNAGVSGTTVENSWFKMKQEQAQNGGAGSEGIVSGQYIGSATAQRVVNTVFRNNYVYLGRWRVGDCLVYNMHDGLRIEGNLIENVETLFGGSADGNIGTFADIGYTVVSNICLNCANEGYGAQATDYKGWLFNRAGNFIPGRAEIAYNLFIHDDGSTMTYRLLQHGYAWGGSLTKDTAIHHNTIVGYDVVFDSPGYNGGQGPGSMWYPQIFDNLIINTGSVFSETSNGHWSYNSANYNSSFRPGSTFRANAVMSSTFVTGLATEQTWYNINENLAYRNTTVELSAPPVFINTTDVGSPDYYKLKVTAYPWVTANAWPGEGAERYPGYIGAVKPQPGGFAIRIR